MERPSCSTSGGQSDGIEREVLAVEGALVVWTALGLLLSLEAGAERAMAIHEETEVQERHLEKMVSERLRAACNTRETYGFPSGPNTTPFGNVFFSLSCLSCCSTRWSCSGEASKGCGGNPVVISTAQRKRDKTGRYSSVMGISPSLYPASPPLGVCGLLGRITKPELRLACPQSVLPRVFLSMKSSVQGGSADLAVMVFRERHSATAMSRPCPSLLRLINRCRGAITHGSHQPSDSSGHAVCRSPPIQCSDWNQTIRLCGAHAAFSIQHSNHPPPTYRCSKRF